MALRILALWALWGVMVVPMAAQADGVLPPQPYRYLHPPPSLASENSPPQSGSVSLQVVGGRSKAGYLFTQDTQAGVVVPAGALLTTQTATSIRLDIRAVETPANLPQHYAAEGNAYSVTATGEPGNAAVRVVRHFNLTLRWPHPPLAIYANVGGKWNRLCYSDNATFTTSTMACPTSALGTFTAVTNPALVGTSQPAPVASSNRFAWLTRYIPVIVVLVVAALVGLVALVTMRPGTKPGDSR
ncbi:MAG: hypothetical protein M3021_09620 [Actinomycetota bacterium]|nr:hypothetical protein [Actinomycetota bacterium]